jgi:hypothetical protein
MTELYSKIIQQFDFLQNVGLNFKYSQFEGKLGDRNIQKFTYDNPGLQKKFEIVYCEADKFPSLFGSIIKYSQANKNPLDPQLNIPFDRLRCFFDEGSEIIFFGLEQYDLSYKLSEFKLIIEKFISCVTQNDWVDYGELLDHERKIYVLTLEPKNHYVWLQQIKSNDFIRSMMEVTYDSSTEPPYEAFGLRLKSKKGLQFHITHGYKSRDDVAFNLTVIWPDNSSKTYEFINVDEEKVVKFIQEQVCT